jgi:peptide/nickel transport system substrate-binding protein
MRSRSVVGAGAIALALILTACGGGNSDKSASSSSSGSGKTGGTLKVLQGTAPDSLDPSYGYTTQAIEADNMVYTPLLAYAAKEGNSGTTLVPGLAQALPTISSDGKTYKLTLRSGLKYSDGTPVKASDFTFAVERAIKLSWGGASFLAGNIEGADAFEAGTAQNISGITTDDATGAITITLTSAYGAFGNVLAFPATAPIPSNTPMSVQATTPPLGVGPYKFGTITPNQGYTLVKNTSFAGMGVSTVPAGYVDTVEVTVQSNTNTEAEQVLQNQADIFDPADVVPAGLLSQVKSQASDRYKQVPSAYTYYFFLNVTEAPFNNADARKAVNMALDRTALSRLGSGTITPACYFLPPTIIGHPSGSEGCPGGDPAKSPSKAQVAKAKALVQSAGLSGSAVTVWSQQRSPRLQYDQYLVSVLNDIGFKATLNTVQDSVYFQTVGNENTHAQAGFADWSQDFPNPADFYLLLSKAGIQPVNAENFGRVNDPKIESQLATLEQVPAGKLQSSASGWESLEKYVAQQGYIAEFGYGTSPRFTSNRISSMILHSVNYIEFNTVQLR